MQNSLRAFPSLAELADRRLTARFGALSITGQMIPGALDSLFNAQTISLFRLTDLAICYFQLSRESFQIYWESPALGGSEPVSRSLLHHTGHMESCITSAHRAILFAAALRRNKHLETPHDPEQWRLIQSRASTIRNIRDAIQHTDEMLLANKIQRPEKKIELAKGEGMLAAPSPDGEIKIGKHSLSQADLASVLSTLHQLCWRLLSSAITRPVVPPQT